MSKMLLQFSVSFRNFFFSCFLASAVFMIFSSFPNKYIQVIIVKNEEGGNSVSTVVLRGSTDSILDDLERAVDDGVNTYKVIYIEYSKSVLSNGLVMICLYDYGQIVVLKLVLGVCVIFHISAFLILFCQAMCRDSRIVPGAAATEIELAKRVKEFSYKETG